MDKDASNLIERLELFEERLGVRLERVSAELRRGHVFVMGELHVTEGMTLDKDIWLIATFYDSEGRILDTQEMIYMKQKFYGFEVFKILSGELDSAQLSNIAKIRVYPKEL